MISWQTAAHGPYVEAPFPFYLLWISDPVRPRFSSITSLDLARSLSNFRTLHFSPSADFCQYGLLTKNQ